ncbi:hypothetical protein NDU88_012833 [Pleurodeles waltl]|uniref:Uncharacterized protein n=1 Tax=Pleurodeles waltl TaxID=8319 RepID=A0AAV7R4D4_PLEWA|nr:hypothetical protein NDU88_012833 [Pleurodeles waltl]
MPDGRAGEGQTRLGKRGSGRRARHLRPGQGQDRPRRLGSKGSLAAGTHWDPERWADWQSSGVGVSDLEFVDLDPSEATESVGLLVLHLGTPGLEKVSSG